MEEDLALVNLQKNLEENKKKELEKLAKIEQQKLSEYLKSLREQYQKQENSIGVSGGNKKDAILEKEALSNSRNNSNNINSVWSWSVLTGSVRREPTKHYIRDFREVERTGKRDSSTTTSQEQIYNKNWKKRNSSKEETNSAKEYARETILDNRVQVKDSGIFRAFSSSIKDARRATKILIKGNKYDSTRERTEKKLEETRRAILKRVGECHEVLRRQFDENNRVIQQADKQSSIFIRKAREGIARIRAIIERGKNKLGRKTLDFITDTNRHINLLAKKNDNNRKGLIGRVKKEILIIIKRREKQSNKEAEKKERLSELNKEQNRGGISR